jgi:glucose-1-phosphate thymidylyltransferase
MKIIVPMAGRGSRLRPHSLTVPKPLIPVAGQPIVHRLVADIARILNEPIEEVAFILGDPAFFGPDVAQELIQLAEGLGAKGRIYRQLEPKGTGHAIMCAEPSLSGPAVVAYADTLIRATFALDKEADSVIWTKKVDHPEAYGVVKRNHEGHITELVEKPEQFVSDEAVIGIYYFKDIGQLKEELQKVMDQGIMHQGEYQINDGIKALMAQGKIFKSSTVDQWMDCGNKEITLKTNTQMLGFLQEDGAPLRAPDIELSNAEIIEPCFLASGAVIKDATVGPFVSVGPRTVIENSTISHSIVQGDSHISNAHLSEAMIGNHVVFDGSFTRISLGDYSRLE